MTRKDYEALAAALSRARYWAAELAVDTERRSPRQVGVEDAIEVVADVLQADNPRFDRERFIAAARALP